MALDESTEFRDFPWARLLLRVDVWKMFMSKRQY